MVIHTAWALIGFVLFSQPLTATKLNEREGRLNQEPIVISLTENQAHGRLHLLVGGEGLRGRFTVTAGDRSHVHQEPGDALTQFAITLDLTPGTAATLTLAPKVGGGRWWATWLVTDADERLSNKDSRWLEGFCAVDSPDHNLGSAQIAFWEIDRQRDAVAATLVGSRRDWQQRHHGAALRRLQQSLNRRPDAPVLTGYLLLEIAQRSTELGAYGAAVTLTQQAETQLAGSHCDRLRGRLHHIAGFAHTITNNFTEARAEYESALQYLAACPYRRRYTQLELAWLERHAGRYTAAAEQSRHLITAAQMAGDDTLAMEGYDRLGSILGLMGDVPAAEQALDASWQLIASADGDATALRAVNHLNRAYLNLKNGNTKRAGLFADLAIALYADQVTQQEGKVTAYNIRAAVHEAQGHSLKALEAYEQALAVAENLYLKSADDTRGIQFFHTTLERSGEPFHLYYRLHQKFPDRGFNRRALALVERMRSAAWHSAAPNQTGHRGQVTLTQKLTQLTPTPNHAVLIYFLDPDCGYWWLWRNNRLAMGTTPGRTALQPLLETFATALSQRQTFDEDAPRRLAGQIASEILPPPALLDQLSDLAVLPDGVLNQLPFPLLIATLSTPTDAEPQPGLQTYPSLAAAWDLNRRDTKTDTARPTFLVFADPIFDGTDIRVTGRSTTRSGAFARLPFSAQELRHLEKNSGAAQVRGFQGLSATRARFEQESRAPVSVIHLATHAFTIPEQPNASALVFSLVDQNGRLLTRPDGFLRRDRIAALELQAELVVLSACSSANGPVFRGEGMMSLARTFLQAGARTVIAALWEIDDEATASLMTTFYEKLLQGQPAATALQQAQSQLARDPRWRHPHFWAGFTLIGPSRTFFLKK